MKKTCDFWNAWYIDVITGRKQITKEMQAVAKVRSRKCFLAVIPRTHRVATRGIESRVRTDFSMLHREFQHGPLKIIDEQ